MTADRSALDKIIVVSQRPKGLRKEDFESRVADWIYEYQEAFDDTEIVEVVLDTFVYLFDLSYKRVVAAYGISVDQNQRRDKARMAGHPHATTSTLQLGETRA